MKRIIHQLIRCCAVMAPALLLIAATLSGQSVVILSAGNGGRVNVAPGSKLAIPMVIDLSAGPGLDVGSLTLDLNYDQTRLTFDSVRGGPFFSDNTGGFNGQPIRLFGGGTPVSSTTTWVTAHFTVAPGNGMTTFTLAPSFLANGSNANILPTARIKNLEICIAPPGLWGDATGDNNVNIIDAQQIARFAVGLSVGNAAALSAQGDVTADNTINIIDAQQVARYSVGLSAALRINTSTSAPTVSTLQINAVLDAVSGAFNPSVPANLAGLVAGKQAQIQPVARDAATNDITPCAPLTYSSSNPAVASVSQTGIITAVGAGTAAITVASGSVSASTNVTVTSTFTTNTWTSAASGNWSNAANWSQGRVPNAGDSAVIKAAGTYSVTVDVTSSVGFVDIGGTSGTQTLLISGQTLTVSGGMNVGANAALTMTGGVVAGTGVLTNSGTFTTTGGTVNIATTNNALIVLRSNSIFGAIANTAGATFRILGDANCCSATLSGNGDITNSGTFEFTSIGNIASSFTFSNNSSLIFTNNVTGIVAVLGAAGTRTFAGNVLNLGSINVSGADLTVQRVLTNAGSGTISIGSGRILNVNNPGVLAMSGGTVSGTGTLAFSSGGLIASTNFAYGGPTITMANAVVSGAGTFTVPSSQTMTSTGGNIASPLIIQGTVVTRSSSVFSAPVSVASGGTLRIQGDAACCSASALFSNASLTNDGIIELTSVNGSTSATLAMAGATLTNSTSGVITSLTGTGGNRQITGPVTNQGTLDVSADLTLLQNFTHHAGAVVTVAAARTVTTGNGATFTAAGGTILGAGNFAVNGGTLAASANVTLGTATATITGSSTGTAVVTIPPGTTANVTSSTFATPFSVQGVLSSRSTTIYNGAVSVAAGGIFRVLGDAACCSANVSVNSTFSNAGTIELTGVNGSASAVLTTGTGNTLVNLPGGTILPLVGSGGTRTLQGVVDNQGTLDVSNGVDLTLSNNINTTGTVTIGAGRKLTAGGAGTLTYTSGTVTGAGTLVMSGGALTAASNFSFGGPAVTLTGTTLNGPGVFTVPASQTVTATSSTIAAPLVVQGTLVLRSNITLSNTVNVASAGFLRLQGDAACCSSATTATAAMTNSGTVELTSVNGSSSATFTMSSGTFTNAAGGVIQPLVGTGGSRTFSAVLDNQGTIDVSNGVDITMSQSVNNAASGTVNVGAGRTLNMGGSSVFTSSGGAMTGAGTFATSSATVSLASNLTGTISNMLLVSTTVSGSGTLTTASGQTLTLQSTTVNSPVLNQGTLVARSNVNINGTFNNPAGGLTRVQGDAACCAATMTVANSFTSAGTIELTGINGSSAGATLNLTNGTLTNASGGLISILLGSGGSRNLGAVILNNGTFDVSNGADVSLTKDVTNNGSIVIGAARTLTMTGSTVFNAGTGSLTGAGTFTANGGTVQVPNATTLGVAQATFTNLVSLSGAGSLTIPSATTLTGQNGTWPLPVTVQSGGAFVTRGTMTVSGALSVQAGGTLRVQSDASVAANVSVSNGFSTTGTVELSSIGTGSSALTVSAGILNIASAGTFAILGNTSTARSLTGRLTMQGTMDLFPGSTGLLTFNSTGVSSINGVLNIDVTSNTAFDRINTSGSNVNVGGTLNVNVPFTPTSNTPFQIFSGTNVTGGAFSPINSTINWTQSPAGGYRLIAP